MHLPVFALVARTMACFCRFEGVLVDGFQGKVAHDILDLAGLNVVFLDLGHRLTDVPAAEGSLEIGEFDQGQLGSLLTFRRCPINSEHCVLGFGGGSGSRSGLQEGFNVPQVLLHGFLSFFEHLDLFAQSLEAL